MISDPLIYLQNLFLIKVFIRITPGGACIDIIVDIYKMSMIVFNTKKVIINKKLLI